MLFKTGPGKECQIQTSQWHEWYNFQLAEMTVSDQTSNTHTEIRTVLSQFVKHGGPENVPK